MRTKQVAGPKSSCKEPSEKEMRNSLVLKNHRVKWDKLSNEDKEWYKMVHAYTTKLNEKPAASKLALLDCAVCVALVCYSYATNKCICLLLWQMPGASA